MAETRILLGGGGSEVDERSVLERFAFWVGTGPVLDLPMAAEEVEPSHWEWISAALTPLGVTHIEMWKTFTGHAPAELDRFRAVFIGGGNTYRLLRQLRSSGFDRPLRDFARQGGILYGGSAGAIVLGRDIRTCAHLDQNITGDLDSSGLDLFEGDAIWCHYQPSDEPLIRAFRAQSGFPVLVLSETGGVWVRGVRDYVRLGTGLVFRIGLHGERVFLD